MDKNTSTWGGEDLENGKTEKVWIWEREKNEVTKEKNTTVERREDNMEKHRIE